MRDWRLPLLFEIKIPDIPIYQSDYQRRAQQDRCCANVISPGCVDTINGNRGVERQYQAEKAKQQAKLYSGTPLEEATRPERDKKRSNKYERRDGIPLCFRQSAKHRVDSISEEDRRNRLLVSCGKGGSPSAEHGLRARGNHEPRPACKKTETADGRNRSEPPDICQRHHV